MGLLVSNLKSVKDDNSSENLKLDAKLSFERWFNNSFISQVITSYSLLTNLVFFNLSRYFSVVLISASINSKLIS